MAEAIKKLACPVCGEDFYENQRGVVAVFGRTMCSDACYAVLERWRELPLLRVRPSLRDYYRTLCWQMSKEGN